MTMTALVCLAFIDITDLGFLYTNSKPMASTWKMLLCPLVKYKADIIINHISSENSLFLSWYIWKPALLQLVLNNNHSFVGTATVCERTPYIIDKKKWIKLKNETKIIFLFFFFSGNVIIETNFYDGDLLVSKSKVRIFYVWCLAYYDDSPTTYLHWRVQH